MATETSPSIAWVSDHYRAAIRSPLSNHRTDAVDGTNDQRPGVNRTELRLALFALANLDQPERVVDHSSRALLAGTSAMATRHPYQAHAEKGK